MYDFLKESLSYYVDVCGKRVFMVTFTSIEGRSSDMWVSFQLMLDSLKVLVDKDLIWFAVRTDEGNGVIHLLLVDCFMPIEWFQSRWYKLHGGFVNLVKIDSIEGVSSYLSSQNDFYDVASSLEWYSSLEYPISYLKNRSLDSF